MARTQDKAKTPRKRAASTSVRKSKTSPRNWSRRVMQTSDALDLESGIFKSGDPDKIAKSLKRSAERSKRKKGTPFQSAMSMLNFYINRAGEKLSARQKRILEKSKAKLREEFHRPQKGA